MDRQDSIMDKNVVSEDDISALIGNFAKETFKCTNSDPFALDVMDKCLNLLRLDYKFMIIDNSKGRINEQYPHKIPIIQHERYPRGPRNDRSSSSSDDVSPMGACSRKRNSLGAPSSSNHSSPEPYARSQSPRHSPKKTTDAIGTDIVSIDTLINEAKFARCRNRFVVPVILYQGKYICRSSTIARMTEIGLGTASEKGLSFEEFRQLDKKRKCDVELLKAWKVGTIIDLMVENEKQKYLIAVTSSEKVDDTQKYAVFRIIPTPYPGCEFFHDFKKNNYNSEGLMFNWSDPAINSTLNVKPNPAVDQLDIQWNKYKEWDLRQLTENYLSLMLKYIWCSSKGILIHCISGWDRTPLFISLIRMSLWADGVIHKSLSPSQMLYLTLGYDWYLFGHNLENRLEKGEDIMHFCFHFLKYIFSDDFKTPTVPSAVTAPNSPKFSSYMGEFDLADLDHLEIRSRHNSNGSNEDLTIGKVYDGFDDYHSQFDFDQTVTTKLKSLKKPTEKFFIKETIYEMDDIEDIDDDDFIIADEVETKRYKCSSPRRRYRSMRSPDSDCDIDDFEFTANVERTMPVDMPSSNKRNRTCSNSSETDEWSMVTQTGSLNGNDITDNKFRTISSRENRLSAIRELFHKCYSTYGYKTDGPEAFKRPTYLRV
ncbi:myotubularin-related protein 14 isoform X1 [Adelges cooleyi]|uniref:myotubularin-related protein 14 isoform X1 n=2 Tax=Adelges cooleyi TaxID=133065 RepID=UPI00218033F9|nr:myotubularin-related protein 14 isoform X1 [Adelges cooleyi]XP_050426201.1 myotubularin-related protein 14 isoform X1 [Adelges cooleyi]